MLRLKLEEVHAIKEDEEGSNAQFGPGYHTGKHTSPRVLNKTQFVAARQQQSMMTRHAASPKRSSLLNNSSDENFFQGEQSSKRLSKKLNQLSNRSPEINDG